MKTIRIPYYSVDRAEARQQFKDAGVENQTAIEIDLRGTTFFGMSYIDELMMQLALHDITLIYVNGVGGREGRLLARLKDYAERHGIGVRTAVYRIPKTRFHHTSMYDPNVHGKKQGFWQRVFAKLHKTNL